MNFYVTRNWIDGYEVWAGDEPPEPCKECDFFKQDTETVVIARFGADEFEEMVDYSLVSMECKILEFPLFKLAE